VINFKTRSKRKSKEEKDAKDVDEARKVIANIEGRLNGEYNLTNPNLMNPNMKKMRSKDATNMPETVHFNKLSVEGQVQKWSWRQQFTKIWASLCWVDALDLDSSMIMTMNYIMAETKT
jgi:hypothetical protein